LLLALKVAATMHNEKFFMSEKEETHTTELIMVGGLFTDDFESQKSVLLNWAQKVKELSEK
jgi:hypothetical protein